MLALIVQHRISSLVVPVETQRVQQAGSQTVPGKTGNLPAMLQIISNITILRRYVFEVSTCLNVNGIFSLLFVSRGAAGKHANFRRCRLYCDLQYMSYARGALAKELQKPSVDLIKVRESRTSE